MKYRNCSEQSDFIMDLVKIQHEWGLKSKIIFFILFIFQSDGNAAFIGFNLAV